MRADPPASFAGSASLTRVGTHRAGDRVGKHARSCAEWGNLYMPEKQDGGDFTDADEVALVFLAQWAASAIENPAA
jgi:GAF domain-containing protein